MTYLLLDCVVVLGFCVFLSVYSAKVTIKKLRFEALPIVNIFHIIDKNKPQETRP